MRARFFMAPTLMPATGKNVKSWAIQFLCTYTRIARLLLCSGPFPLSHLIPVKVSPNPLVRSSSSWPPLPLSFWPWPLPDPTVPSPPDTVHLPLSMDPRATVLTFPNPRRTALWSSSRTRPRSASRPSRPTATLWRSP